MAEILRFPHPPVRPRLVAVNPLATHNQAECEAIVHHLVKAGEKLLAAVLAPETREASISASAEEVEAALFHLLTLKGACNADLPLRRLLAARDAERTEN